MTRLEAGIITDNPASAAVLRRIGARPTPQRRGYRFGTFTLTLLIIVMLAALAG